MVGALSSFKVKKSNLLSLNNEELISDKDYYYLNNDITNIVRNVLC